MNEQTTQTEIKAIQERLQAMRAGHPGPRPAAPAPMVEMFPSQFAPVNLTRDSVSRNMGPEDRTTRPGPGLGANSRSAPVSAAARLLPQQEALQQLEAKAQQINQLSAAQETAMLELKAIATRLERDWTALDRQQGDAYTQDGSFPVPSPVICEYLVTTVPAIERDKSGVFVMTTRAVDLFKAEREATVMAQTLRHRTGVSTTRRRRVSESPTSMRIAAGASRWLQSLWTQFQAIANLVTAQSSVRSTRRLRMHQNDARGYADPYPQDDRETDTISYTLSYRTSALWLGGAVIVRIAADLFLASHPGFWLPVVALMVAPTAIAVYRTTVAPQSSLVWGYRLLLIMIGLLLGGRLL